MRRQLGIPAVAARGAMTVGERTALAAVLVAGIVLRCTALAVHSLWFDEGLTLVIAEAEDPLALLTVDRHPPLSFLVFRVWIAAFGTADATLRLLPALVSCASLLLFAALARAWLPARSRLLAVALAAVSPFSLWIAHEVRMYAFVEFAAVVALLALARWVAGRKRRWLVVLAISTTFAVGTHYMGALVVAAVGAVLAVEVFARRVGVEIVRAPLAAACAGIAVWIPWLWFALPGQMRAPWGWDESASLRALAELPARQVLVDGSVVREPWYLAVVAAALLVSAALYACLAAAVFRPRDEGARCAAAWVGPVLGLLAMSAVIPPTLDARTLTAAVPGAVGCIACGLALVRPVWLRGALGAFLLGVCLAVALATRAGNRREDYRTACAEVAAAWQPGDRIVAVAGTPDVYAQHLLRHEYRGRPELLAALVGVDTAYAAPLGETPGRGRLHVVYRVAEYARPQLELLRERYEVVHAGDVRFRVQALILE